MELTKRISSIFDIHPSLLGVKEPMAHPAWGYGTVLKHRDTATHTDVHGAFCPCRVMVVHGNAVTTLVSNDGSEGPRKVGWTFIDPAEWEAADT